MKIRIETEMNISYEEIRKKYGDILEKFNLQKEGQFGYIILDSIEDIKKLHNMLFEAYKHDNIDSYAGLLFNQDSYDNSDWYLQLKEF